MLLHVYFTFCSSHTSIFVLKNKTIFFVSKFEGIKIRKWNWGDKKLELIGITIKDVLC